MISFFMIRILLENKKTSVKSVDYRVPVRRAPWSGKKITQLNLWHIEGHYDFANEVEARVSLQFLVNQFIHCKLIHATRDRDRNWSEIFFAQILKYESLYIASQWMRFEKYFPL